MPSYTEPKAIKPVADNTSSASNLPNDTSAELNSRDNTGPTSKGSDISKGNSNSSVNGSKITGSVAPVPNKGAGADLPKSTSSGAKNMPNPTGAVASSGPSDRPRVLASASQPPKKLNPNDPNFVNPYAAFVASVDPLGNKDDGRSYVGKASHHLDRPQQSNRNPPIGKPFMGSPAKQSPKPSPFTKPASKGASTPKAAPGPKFTPPPPSSPNRQSGFKKQGYSTLQSGREYSQSCWSGRPLVTASKLPDGFFGIAKVATPSSSSTPSKSNTAQSTPAARSSTSNSHEFGRTTDYRGENGFRKPFESNVHGGNDSRRNDDWLDGGKSQRMQSSQRHEDDYDFGKSSSGFSASTFFSTPTDTVDEAMERISLNNANVQNRQRTESAPSSSRKEVFRSHVTSWLDDDSNGSQNAAKRGPHGFQAKNGAGNGRADQQPAGAWMDETDAPAARDASAARDAPAARDQDMQLDSDHDTSQRVKDVTQVSRLSDSGGDPCIIQYPIGDGCWVKMVVYVEKDMKTANSRLPGLSGRQYSSPKPKTPEDIGILLKDILVEEKQSILG
ncbi:hypothetical protein BGZ94_009588 [Podila epigama]|nr:hypothetical protein BGZ94_009588 [Podila epigama]